MGITTILKNFEKITICDCSKCGHAWVKKQATITKKCPKCQAKDWNMVRGE